MGKTRLHVIDEYRGFCIINMILFHGVWDLVYIFGCDWKWFQSEFAFYWQQWACWSFIFVSGFCWQMSRQHVKRGLQVFGAGILITVATLLFMPDSRVLFGVLTMLGSAMLLMIPCDKLFQKINPWVGTIVSSIIFLFVYPVNDGYLGFFGKRMVILPRELYSSMFATYLGFPEPGFWSTDYFSIFPWFFLYIAGYFMHHALLAGENVERQSSVKCILAKSICSPLGWLGRKSLIVYMVHQPIVYGILYLCHICEIF